MPSARFVEAILSPNSAECIVEMVTIEHDDLTETLRYCTGGVDIVSNERVFKARAMKLAKPGQGREGAKRARFTIDNIEQDAVAELRSVTKGRPAVTYEIVLAAYPDDIEEIVTGLQLTAIRPQGETLELEIAPRDDSEEEFPVQSFSPGRTPGLF